MAFPLAGIIGAVVVGVCVIVGVGSRRWLSTDNPVEEISEKIIENRTSYLIDLSPDTPDPDDIKKVNKSVPEKSVPEKSVSEKSELDDVDFDPEVDKF